jgi:hypothetical protein
MAADKTIYPADPPPPTIESSPEVMLAAINALTQQLATSQADRAALRADIRRRDAADAVEWVSIKAAASLTETPYPTVHRWLSAGHLKSRTENGRVAVFLKSVLAHIKRLGRDNK